MDTPARPADPILMSPQPWWEEDPLYDPINDEWYGRYRVPHQVSEDEADYSIEVEAVRPPASDLEPRLIDGMWFWVGKQKQS